MSGGTPRRGGPPDTRSAYYYIYTHMCVYIYIYMSLSLYIYIYIYIYTHLHAYNYMCIYRYVITRLICRITVDKNGAVSLRLLEYGWKPHRIVGAQKSLSRASIHRYNA